MGVVYRAVDNILGREIAIKVLRDSRLGPESTSRFVDEALVTSQLQHPGIPSTYDLVFADGQPFLTMKLIKGETLSDKIKSCTTPSQRGELIAVFEQICQAVAYAHKHQIIHRDLKPSNIMVGAFGEVQVMDWGLAKKLVAKSGSSAAPLRTAHEEQTEIRTNRESDHEGTTPGSVLGTAAFASPEQAGGEIDRMDERADVFGLGAVLCTILTGKPPYVAETIELVRLLAIRGELGEAFERLNQCGADPELIQLCQDCLARDLNHRPRDAKAVTDRVAAYRSGVELRLRHAEQAVVVAAAEAREMRKRRRITLALLASFFLLVMGASAALWWNQKQQAERLAEAELTAERALIQAEQIAANANKLETISVANAEADVALWRQATTAAEQAEAIAEGANNLPLLTRTTSRVSAIRDGLNKSQTRLARAQRDRAFIEALDRAHGMSADLVQTASHTHAARAYRAAFLQAGLPVDASAETLASAIREEGPSTRDAILASIDHWAWCLATEPDAARIRAAADLVDGDLFRSNVRAAIASKQLSTLLELVKRSEIQNLPPLTATLLGRGLVDCNACDAETRVLYCGAAARLLYAVRERDPSDYWVIIELANALWELPPEPSLGWSDSISCLRAALALRPNSAMTHFRLGCALQLKGNAEIADIHYAKAVKLDPSIFGAWYNWGHNQALKGDLIAAEKSSRKAIECDPNSSRARNALGLLLVRVGRTKEAEQEFRKCIQLEPHSGEYHMHVAYALEKRGIISEAMIYYRRATELAPQDTLILTNHGESRCWDGDWAAAEESFRRALKIDAKCFRAHQKLGGLFLLRGDMANAESSVRMALQFNSKDCESLFLLGKILEHQGNAAGAEQCHRESGRYDKEHSFANAFEVNRLSRHPLTPAELKRILEETLKENPTWSDRQRRAAKSSAALVAIRSSYSTSDAIRAEDRPGLREMAHLLFTELLADYAASLAKSPDSTAEEFLSTTASWLGHFELAPVRNLFSLLTLPGNELRQWAKLWENIRSLRTKCLNSGPP